MTRTIVASATREVIIGFDQPFCVIGERINPTGRKKLAAEMVEGNFDTVIKDALEQVAAGATMLDVNAGVTSVNPNETEPGLLVQTMEIVQGLVDVPLSIDSSVTAAIEAALKVAKGRPLVNSVTGEMEKLEAILPLCKKYDVPVVAISNDETGISEDPDVRFAVAKKIVEHAADYGIKPMTSWSTRWSCRLAPWAPPASRSSRCCAGCARSSRSTPPAACPTSPSACRTATASMPASSRW
jgi:5-methyltetrahydrofolate--homocysteine methyltransferase